MIALTVLRIAVPDTELGGRTHHEQSILSWTALGAVPMQNRHSGPPHPRNHVRAAASPTIEYVNTRGACWSPKFG